MQKYSHLWFGRSPGYFPCHSAASAFLFALSRPARRTTVESSVVLGRNGTIHLVCHAWLFWSAWPCVFDMCD